LINLVLFGNVISVLCIASFAVVSVVYTVSQNKHATILLSVTSPNVDRISKFFSMADSVVNLLESHYETFYHTLKCCYTTMRNINVKN